VTLLGMSDPSQQPSCQVIKPLHYFKALSSQLSVGSFVRPTLAVGDRLPVSITDLSQTVCVQKMMVSDQNLLMICVSSMSA
jgi:hypothetical protein